MNYCIINDPRLETDAEREVLDLIWNFQRNNKTFYGSDAFISNKTGISEYKIDIILLNLQKRNIISIDNTGVRQISVNFED